MRFELQNFWHDVYFFRRFEFFDWYCCFKLFYNFFTNLWSCFSRFHIEFIRSQVNNFFLDIEDFTAFKTLLLILFFFRISTLWANLHKCDETNRFFRCFLEFDDEFDDEFIARFRLNDTNVAQYLIDFDNWYVEKKSTKIFSFFLFVVKLKSLTNNQVMSYLDLEIAFFDDFFDSCMIFVRIIFNFEIYRIFFHFFIFDHVVDNNSKHQIIIEYCVWERKIDFFEDVFSFSTNASIFLVLCCFWFIFLSSDFSAMRHLIVNVIDRLNKYFVSREMFEIFRSCSDIKRINEFNKRIMSSSDKIKDDNEEIEIICLSRNDYKKKIWLSRRSSTLKNFRLIVRVTLSLTFSLIFICNSYTRRRVHWSAIFSLQELSLTFSDVRHFYNRCRIHWNETSHIDLRLRWILNVCNERRRFYLYTLWCKYFIYHDIINNL
jgi:hypothetical protein